MNAERRKELMQALALLTDGDVRQNISDARAKLANVAEQEREAFDNMPEGLQQGETGQQMEQNADTLDEQVQALDDMADAIEEVINELEGLENG